MVASGEGWTLYNADCLDVLPTLEAGSVDAVITDPPYGTTACKWDTPIPFEPMWAGIKHVIKRNAAVVLFGSQPFTSALVMSNPKWFRYELIWEKSKPVGFLDAFEKPLRAHENVCVFYQAQPTYNPQKWEIDPLFIDRRKARNRARKDAHVYHSINPSVRQEDDGTRFPLSLIPVRSEWAKGMHPSQKPVALLEYLIRTYTNEGETVLDFTMGSGTTGVACLNTGRRFIGVELDEGYFDIAARRLEAAAAQKRLAV